MPLIKYRENTLRKEFLLSSLSIALISVFAIAFKKFIDNYIENNKLNEFYSLLITFVSTFAFAMVTYLLLYIVFGFGGGMVAPEKELSF